MNIFAEHAPRYWSSNLPVMPTIGKKPVLKQWQQFADRMPSLDEQESWLLAYANHNIGLPLGRQSGLCAVDIDIDDREIIDAIRSVLPDSPYVRIGRKGCVLMFRFADQRNFKFNGEAGSICEFLGAGNQVILPPSIHPDTGEPYQSDSHLGEVLADIPLAPIDIHDRLESMLVDLGLITRRTRTRGNLSHASADLGRFSSWIAPKLEQALAELSSAEPGERNNTLFQTSVRVAKDIAAAGLDWQPVADRFRLVAHDIGEEDHKVESTLASAWNSGRGTPTPWIGLCMSWVYLSGDESFYHIESSNTLSEKGFNAEFGSHKPVDKGSFSQFLLGNNYVEKVQSTTYDPRQQQGIIEREGRGWFNTFRPSEVMAVEGDASLFEGFMRHLAPDDDERAHLSRALAYLVRNPDQKLDHALMIGSEQHGLGKSTLMDILWELMGPTNCRKASSAQLEEKYTSYIEGTRLVLVEELGFGSSGLGAYNNLKDIITARRSPVRSMYRDVRQVDNFASFIFLTNRRIPLMIEPEDRRIWFMRINSPKPTDDYWREFHAWWPSNLGVIRYWFDQIDLSAFSPRTAPPMTAAKLDLIEDSRSPLAFELKRLMDERRAPFHVDVTTFDTIAEHMKLWCGVTVRRKELEGALRDIGALPLGQHQINWKVNHLQQWHLGNADKPSLWAIRNAGYWRSVEPAARVKEYLSEENSLPELPRYFEYAVDRSAPMAAELSSAAQEDTADSLASSINARLLSTVSALAV